MKLSELKTGEYGVIDSIDGNGDFVKRVTEMGFIKGRKVLVVKNAPLKDPIEYQLMGYDISLRRKEADLIEVMVVDKESDDFTGVDFISNKRTQTVSMEKSSSEYKQINVAIIGNPNSGKTTLFNEMSNSDEHVGNYSGVTIDSKIAEVKFKGYTINITDLPGTYSLTTYSPEEVIVRDMLIQNRYDCVINVVDATILERNMFLTTQIMDMGCEMVVALNMYDELQSSGDIFDYKSMTEMLSIPFVPTVAKKGRGIPHILDEIVKKYEDNPENRVKVDTNFGYNIEEKIKLIENFIVNGISGFSLRFSAIMLLERNRFFIDEVSGEVRNKCEQITLELERKYNASITSICADARYGYVAGALKDTLTINSNRYKQSKAIDSVLTHKIWGFPVFALIMWIMFYSTFTFGGYPQMGIDYIIELIQKGIITVMNEGPLRDLLTDGIIGGVGGVIVFLPNILILFFFISLMEDSGYMARAAFIMDKLMHRIGLHGKSFIPLIMGFGCNVPAIMATRIIEDKGNRLLTILISPLVSCSARLPVYILIIGAFFPVHASLLLFGIYLFGMLLAVTTSIVFKRLLFKSKDQPFVMELPPYRIPSMKLTLKSMWSKGLLYIRKMGGIILIASVIVWSLSYFPTQGESYLKRIGRSIEPVVAPLGFDWKIGVGLMSGIAAKEVIVSTIGVINQIEAADGEGEVKLTELLKKDRFESGPRKGELVFTTPTVFSFLAFVLIYFPCIAVVAAIRRETGMWKWGIFTMVYTTTLAWVVSFAVYNILNLF